MLRVRSMNANAKRILVVDDEPKIVDVVKSYLEKNGYAVVTAYGGREAYEKFGKEDPSLIILDWMLPDITGEEICRTIRKTSKVPIIMLTARAEEENILKGFGFGADDYVVKPFSPRQLVARVGALLRRTRTEPSSVLSFNRMVGDLEKLEKAEADNAVLERSEFDLTELVSHIIHNFEPDFYKKGVAIGFTGNAETIRADPDKISQVLINLISNALKYTPEGGKVEIEVKSMSKAVELIVRDTGYGIPPEDLPNIFERFYRADKSRNRLTGGSGLGLTIAKAIVEAHKGSIRVKSERNKGTEFQVVLPKR